MIEVNLEHMNFEHRDFVTINSERINRFLDLDGEKVPSRVKGVNFDTIPQLLLNEICNTWEYCVKGGKSFDDFLMYCEDNFSSVDLFKDFLRHQRNQLSDLDETTKFELVSEDEIIFQEGTTLNLYVRLKGDLRTDTSDKYVESIIINVHFRNDEDRRDSLIGYPEYQALCDTCEDPGYDEYLSKFRGNDERFKGYDGTVGDDTDVEIHNLSLIHI